METTHKVIIALLILAIIFSVISIFISLIATKINLPKFQTVSGQAPGLDSGNSGLSLYIESNKTENQAMEGNENAG